jgi:chromate reductase
VEFRLKLIISGTNRPGSRSLQVAKLVQKIYREHGGEETEILDLAQLPLEQLLGEHYGSGKPEPIQVAIDKINKAEGLVIVCPEYNGSMPGVLKYFIDHWNYPESFEYRPIALIGLGGRFGGMRPVEHLQQVFGYRNAFLYPERVFLSDIWTLLKDGEIQDAKIRDLLVSQTTGFQKFVHALQTARLDTLSRPKSPSK